MNKPSSPSLSQKSLFKVLKGFFMTNRLNQKLNETLQQEIRYSTPNLENSLWRFRLGTSFKMDKTTKEDFYVRKSLSRIDFLQKSQEEKEKTIIEDVSTNNIRSEIIYNEDPVQKKYL